MIGATATASHARLPLAAHAAGHPPANFGLVTAHAVVQNISVMER